MNHCSCSLLKERQTTNHRIMERETMALRDWIVELHSQGQPLTKGEWTITPVSRVLVVQIPGSTGGIIWNRPAFVRVERTGEPERILPVRDHTRLALFGIAGIFMLGMFLARFMIRKDE
jgi:hypothetical protein